MRTGARAEAVWLPVGGLNTALYLPVTTERKAGAPN